MNGFYFRGAARAAMVAAFGAAFLYAADAKLWKVAPPPPASRDAGRVADLAARRKVMAEQIGDKGILILYAAEPRNYAGDVDWPLPAGEQFLLPHGDRPDRQRTGDDSRRGAI